MCGCAGWRLEWFRGRGRFCIAASACPMLWVFFPAPLPANGLCPTTPLEPVSCLWQLQTGSQFDRQVLISAVYAAVYRGIDIRGRPAYVYTAVYRRDGHSQSDRRYAYIPSRRLQLRKGLTPGARRGGGASGSGGARRARRARPGRDRRRPGGALRPRRRGALPSPWRRRAHVRNTLYRNDIVKLT